MSRLIIIGASGHGKVIADIAARCGYTDIAFLDDNPNIRECMGYPVIGKSKRCKRISGCKVYCSNRKSRNQTKDTGTVGDWKRNRCDG